MKRCHHRSGQCYLPDKEFRYLRTVQCVSIGAGAPLARSSSSERSPAYRYADRTVSSTTSYASCQSWLGVQSLRILPIATIDPDRPCDRKPFLLIVRTSRIVTATWRGEYRRMHRSFQQIAKFIYVTTIRSKLCSCGLPIVTAAVYRGFDQELRLAADPIT